MKTCKNCGAEMQDNEKVCPNCGTENTEGKKFEETIAKINDTKDESSNYAKEDIEKNKILSLFSYLGILILVPVLACKDSKYARFHVNQGLTLLILTVIVNVVTSIFSVLLGLVGTIISWVLGLGCMVLAVIGIINAVQGKAKELPLIGKIRILK